MIPVPNKKNIQEVSAALGRAVEHVEFKKIIEEIKSASQSDRFGLAVRLANMQEMKNRGIPIPKGTKVSLRGFEKPNISENISIKPNKSSREYTVCLVFGSDLGISIGTSVDIEIEEVDEEDIEFE